MVRGMYLLAFAALLATPGCGHRGKRVRVEAPPSPQRGWKSIATARDRERIRGWRDSWTTALAEARASGHGAKIAAQGPLLQPDAALADPAPPPGDYRCRVTKLGAQGPGGPDYVAYPAFNCRIAAGEGGLSFAKLDGSQRPVGTFYPGDEVRMIFLGTLMLGDETRALDYGRDPERDMAGALERIGPKRWRLVLPWPKWESTLDVIELAPRG